MRVASTETLARDVEAGDRLEWLEADEFGGFAMGTASGVRTRRYHALLTVATTPPTGRVTLVQGVEAWLETASGRHPLSTHRYEPDVLHPEGAASVVQFTAEPWPTWRHRLPDGSELVHEVFVWAPRATTVLTWTLPAVPWCRLEVRPFLGGRDLHALHRENDRLRFDARVEGGNVRWRPYPDLPSVAALSSGRYRHEPLWFRRFAYVEERARGLEHVEDLASPGVFFWEGGERSAQKARVATLLLRADAALDVDARRVADLARQAEGRRRRAEPDRARRSAQSFLVRRGEGVTLVAGFPWFTDWGRDTFIALRGLFFDTDRLDDAAHLLEAWSDTVKDGMLPNRFPDHGVVPEYNSVDASLWFVVAVDELLTRAPDLPSDTRARLERAVRAVVEGYAAGTHHGIRADDDGLLAAGVPGLQLTWMDAKVGDWVVTPRVGKPVEVQALWINALAVAARLEPRWAALAARALAAFPERFWDEGRGHLRDVVDVDHERGRVDASCRPNQVFAVGGLPLAALEGARAARVVDVVESRLWTPLGLRTLAPDEEGYRGTYAGGVRERDGAYHQGTAWAWLLEPFVDAWLRCRGDDAASRAEARARFVAPLEAHLDRAGLGHVSEIVDGDPPHHPRGAPFQAWSLAALLRMRARTAAPSADPPGA